jgi:cysteine desulfurase/selenocysteine lyase
MPSGEASLSTSELGPGPLAGDRDGAPRAVPEPTRRFDPRSIRADFPALERQVRPGVPLVYLDNAATALKPWPVIRAVQAYDADFPANVHRGLHTLSEEATAAYEAARIKISRFLNAASESEIVFTRGTTDAINLVALSWGRSTLQAGDEIVLTAMEHHANLVPWLMLAQEKGLNLRYAELTTERTLDLDSLDRQLSNRTRLVAVSAMSNVLGTIVPLAEVARRAHGAGAVFLVDAAQAVPHLGVDVRAVDADFLAFSGHKMCGPTGIGVLYGRQALLESMPPVVGGGDMVTHVDRKGAEWNELPWKFEAGTPPIAQAIGLGSAVDYLGRFPWHEVVAHQQELIRRTVAALAALDGVHLLTPPVSSNGGAVSFTVDRIHPHDLAQILDRSGVAIRAGQHCAMPLHQTLGVPASARASVYLYNVPEDVDALAAALLAAQRIFHRR